MSAQHPIAPDSYRLERAGRVLHAGTADGGPNLTKPELRALAATARALAASAEAEIDARPAPFPATLPPWLVMQWLSFRDVSTSALRVASSWCGGSEQYFRVFAERQVPLCHSLAYVERGRSPSHDQPGGPGSCPSSRSVSWPIMSTNPVDTPRRTFHPDRRSRRRHPRRDGGAGQDRSRVPANVSLKRLYASPTGRGHLFAGLTSLERRVVDYHNEHGAGSTTRRAT